MMCIACGSEDDNDETGWIRPSTVQGMTTIPYQPSTNNETNKPQQSQRGCCSWHDGICGCDNGKTVCCDGSYSPTCSC